MGDVIVRAIKKRVENPVAVIQDGEVHFTDLPDDITATLLFLRDRTGGDHIDAIRTKSGIDVWVDDEYRYRYNRRNILATSIALSLGSNKPDIRGPVVLATATDRGDTAPLTDDQLGHIVRLAVAVYVPIRTIP